MTESINKADPFFDREAQKYVKPIPSREFIIQYLEELGSPVKRSQLIKAFKLTSKESQEALRRRLNAMLRDGQLLINRKGNYALVNQMALVRGHVVCHKEGYGFLIPDDGSDDVFLNPRQVRSLFPGDRILVSVTTNHERGKREGAVVEILERSFTQIVGRYIEEKGVAFIVPSNKNVTQEIIIPKGKEANAQEGQIVVSEIISYPTERTSAMGRVVEVLGEHMAPGMEIEVAIRAHGLPFAWSDEVLAEGGIVGTVVTEEAKAGRQELQHLPFVTIDGEDARDFDDAVYCKRQAKGGWILYVAIADVSHYVHFDTQLDQEALKRGNSVYFPQHVIPMLPEVLSNELCSLKPKVERLAMICEMRIAENGEIGCYRFYDAVIKSHARFTYTEVFAQLEKKTKKPSVLLPQLQELQSLYHALLKQRKARGALDFSRIETRIVFSKDRKIERIEPVEHNYVHGIIEECMLAANVCASLFLLKGKIPALYRVHEGPSLEKLTDLRSFLVGLGLELKGGNKPKTINYASLLEKIIGRPDEHLVQTVLLRSLRQATYTPENVGHFGLAYEAYAHFTSPIRRYPDLINHRAIRYLLHGGKVKNYAYTQVMMQNFGDHASQTERRADDATRDVTAWLKCEFMRDKIGKTFVGIISGVTNFGVFVELKDIFVEGLVHVTSLKNDYYNFDAPHHRLVGKRSGVIYRLGDPVKALVTRVNLDDRQIDFELVG
ncbi:RNase R [Gammaproteobacteria bacterium]